MASNLKLEIFRISLKKKNGRNNALYNYKELFDLIDKNKETAYNAFVAKFIAYFDNEFKMNADGNKGISSSANNKYEPKFTQNIINGEVNGGPTDMEQTIYKCNNAKKKTGKLENDDIATLPFFFKLWTPYDHNTGVLMVQSYSNETITTLIKLHLTKFIQKFGYSLIITPYINKGLVDAYCERSNVYKVTYVKERLNKSKRQLINPIFTEFENLKVKIEVSGFKKSIMDFWDNFNKHLPIGSNLSDFDIKEVDDYEVIAHYEDENGHKASTGIAKDYVIKPTIFLPDALKRANSNYYDFGKIAKYTQGILDQIKIEIQYAR